MRIQNFWHRTRSLMYSFHRFKSLLKCPDSIKIIKIVVILDLVNCTLEIEYNFILYSQFSTFSFHSWREWTSMTCKNILNFASFLSIHYSFIFLWFSPPSPFHSIVCYITIVIFHRQNRMNVIECRMYWDHFSILNWIGILSLEANMCKWSEWIKWDCLTNWFHIDDLTWPS